MSADHARRLELARAAWRAAQTDESDADAAVRRLSRRMTRRRPRDPARRVVGLGAALLAFGAAVAFAASGGVALPFAESPHAAEGTASLAHLPGPSLLEDRQLAPLVQRGSEAKAPRDPSEPGPPKAEEPPPRPRRVLRPPAAPPPASLEQSPPAQADERAEVEVVPEKPPTWRDVGEALAAKDDAKARRALDALGKDADPVTRAKARLGLAQLAASRGDCPRARTLALEVASSPDADARTAARARALAARCQ